MTTQDADAVFDALADATRRRILALLADGEERAGDVAAAFDVSRPAVSRHLSVLETVGLVTSRRDGRQRFYRLETGPLDEVYAFLQRLDGHAAARTAGAGVTSATGSPFRR